MTTERNASGTLVCAAMDGPLAGRLCLAATEAGVCAVAFGDDEAAFVAGLERTWGVRPVRDEARLAEAARQIREYLAGQRTAFDLPLDLRRLTPFQRQVLEATQQIPYGQTVSYKELARRIGRSRAVRAVGRAEATNPIPIVIPCHRVVGSDGSLTGYGGGIALKRALLRLEGRRRDTEAR